MMAVRERAVAVMAALDRRVPSLDDFAGQSWSSWVERAKVFVPDGSDAEECSKNGKKKVETMTLRKEDMSIFGHCPAHDDFYLVVCSHCSQVVKPQAFEKHCERRHGPLSKLYGRLHPSPSSSLQRPRHGHPPSLHGASHAARDGRHQGAGPPRVPPQPPLTPPQYRHVKSQKEAAGFSPLDKVSGTAPPGSSSFKQPPPSESPPESPAPSLRDPPWPHGATPPSVPPASEKPLQRRGEPGRSPSLLAPLRGPRTYKKVSRKECDLDKHCGVLDPERKKLCTRLLTCNIHSIHQRRKVIGRSKNFDQLVAELKTGSKARERPAPSREGPEGSSPGPEVSGDQMGGPHCRRHLASSTAFRTRTSSESAPEEERARPEEQEAQMLSPPAHSRLSSEESEGEGQEENPEWHSSPWHPKPLAFCSFGSHALGRSVFTFDRRLHHLRSALNAMVEHHLNAHLWKKIPQATDVQTHRTLAKGSIAATVTGSSSQHSTVSTARGVGLPSASSLRTSSSNGAGRETRPQNCSPSSGTTCGLSEGTGSSQPVTPPLPASTSSPSGLSRPRNPVGRPSKQQVRLKQVEQATTSRKRRVSPEEDDSPSHDRNSVLHDKGRLPVLGRTAPSPHGPVNGALSPGHKPRPQTAPAEPHSTSPGLFKRVPPPIHTSPDPSSRGRGGGSSLHSKTVSYDHKGLGRKSKDSSPSSPKAHRLPASSHSSFFSWKKDGKGGGLSTGLEKKLSTQKPKLHH
ncbi:ataxin-7-like protein 2a [Megalops cyprinoides]|uniref:ataxin-7-like protein 2a n=1 Tax=Megalops cyprinoides TaxID=118141 RepID=UPI001863F583|nr:ataxin-7-like protein 2a [Megalops cyprinoides]